MVRRSHLFPELANARWVLWVSHPQMSRGKWHVLLSDLAHSEAVKEKREREQRCRDMKIETRFQIAPQGVDPER